MLNKKVIYISLLVSSLVVFVLFFNLNLGLNLEPKLASAQYDDTTPYDDTIPDPTFPPDECTADIQCGSPYPVFDSLGQQCGICTPQCTGGGPRVCTEDCTCLSGGGGGGGNVRIQANGSDGPINVSFNTSVVLSWTSANMSSCDASGDWSGSKPRRGSEPTGNLTQVKTYHYRVSCLGPGISDSDMVDVTVSGTPTPTPTPTPPTVDIKANGSDGPVNISWNTSANLAWTSTNASSCNASGDWSGSKALNSSQSTGNLTQVKTYNYTLTCSGNGSASDSVAVVVNAPAPVASNVTLTEPNYCIFGPGGVVSWTYSDSNSPFSPQNGYRVQVVHFTTSAVVYDSCPSGSGCGGGSSTNNTITTGLLGFNQMYYARVMSWNSLGLASSWTDQTSCVGSGCIVGGVRWQTPLHAYPATDFTFSPFFPAVGSVVTFTDATVFDPSSGGKQWNWYFGGGSPGTANLQGPHGNTYSTSGAYAATLIVSDNAGTCSKVKTVNIQKALPQWREVLPR
ncbi:MAG: PKD domain-containing protein [Candidatus Taylorbacteria bacterium]|nr:PKD domain-containing protein [Candidatus Taylorbacteria bacterium]